MRPWISVGRKSNMKRQYWISLVGIIAIVCLDLFALHKGIDGTALSASAAGIGAIVGYVIKRH